MEINIECSVIQNEDFSQFLDGNSQIYLNEEESFIAGTSSVLLATPQNQIQQLKQQTHQPISAVQQFENQAIDSEQQLTENLIVLLQQKQPEQETQKDYQLQTSKFQTQVFNQQENNSEQAKDQVILTNRETLTTVEIDKQETTTVTVTSQTNTSNNNNSQWQKVSLPKRRNDNSKLILGNKNTESVKSNIIDLNKGIQQSQQQQMFFSEDKQPTFRIINQEQQQIEMVSKQQQLNRVKTIKEKYAGVIAPVFDCLFCCQEHFVLTKMNEQSLIKKYNFNQDLFCNVQKNKEFKDIERMVFLDKLLNKGQNQEDNEENNDILEQQTQQRLESKEVQGISCIERSIKTLQEIFEINPIKPTLLKHVDEKFKKIKKQSNLNKSKIQILTQQQQQIEIQHQSMMICEMLGKSVHDLNLCVNPRNRKQRIRMNISFESDYFNIYDPCYTSEEELDSICNQSNTKNGDKKQKQKKKAMVDESRDDFATSSEEEDLIQQDQQDFSDESDEEQRDQISNYSCEDDYIDKIGFGKLATSSIHKQTMSDVNQLETEQEQEINEEQQSDLEGSSISSIQRQDAEDQCFNDSSDSSPSQVENIITMSKDQNQNQEQQIFLPQNQQKKRKVNKMIDDDEGSEKLTFGCATPPQDDQKVTFSNCGDNSLSPVRTVKSFTQQNDMTSSNQKNALFLNASPITIPENTDASNTNAMLYLLNKKMQDDAKNFQNLVQQNETVKKQIDFYPKNQIMAIGNQYKSYDTDQRYLGNILSQINKQTESSKEEESEADDYLEEDEELINGNTIENDGTREEYTQGDTNIYNGISINTCGKQVETEILTHKQNQSNVDFKQLPFQSQQQSNSFTGVTSSVNKNQKLMFKQNLYNQQDQQKQPISQQQFLQKITQNQFKSITTASNAFNGLIAVSGQADKINTATNKQAQFDLKKIQIEKIFKNNDKKTGLYTPLEFETNNKTDNIRTAKRVNTITDNDKDKRHNLSIGVDRRNDLVAQNRLNLQKMNQNQSQEGQVQDCAQIKDYQKQQKRLQQSNPQLIGINGELIAAASINLNSINQYSITTGSKSVSSKQNNEFKKTNGSLNQDIFPTNGNITSQNNKMKAFAFITNGPKNFEQKAEAKPMSQKEMMNFCSALCSNRYSTTSDNQVFAHAIHTASIDRRQNEEIVKKKKKQKKLSQNHKRDVSKISTTMRNKSNKKQTQKKGKTQSKNKNSSTNSRQKSMTKTNILTDFLIPTQQSLQMHQLEQYTGAYSNNNKNSNDNINNNELQLLWYNNNQNTNKNKQNSVYMSIQESTGNLQPDNIAQVMYSANGNLTSKKIAQKQFNMYNNNNTNSSIKVEENKQYQCFLNNHNKSNDSEIAYSGGCVGAIGTSSLSIDKYQNNNQSNTSNGCGNLTQIINKKQRNIDKNSQRGSISVQRGEMQKFCQTNQNTCYRERKNDLLSTNNKQQEITTNNNQIHNSSTSNGQFSFSQSSVKLNLTSNIQSTKPSVKNKKKKGKNSTSNNIQINSTSSSSTLKNNSAFNKTKKKKETTLRTRSTSKQSNKAHAIPTHQLLCAQQLGNNSAQSQFIMMKNSQALLGQQLKQIYLKQNGKEDNKLKLLLKQESSSALVNATNNKNHQPKLGSNSKVSIKPSNSKSKNTSTVSDDNQKIYGLFKALSNCQENNYATNNSQAQFKLQQQMGSDSGVMMMTQEKMVLNKKHLANEIIMLNKQHLMQQKNQKKSQNINTNNNYSVPFIKFENK